MSHYKSKTIIYLILIIGFFFYQNAISQPSVIDAVHYSQISSFETDYSISEMKMSADGSKIVFATSGPQVKVFTINSNGTGLTLVFDYEAVGSGPVIDISDNGNKVIWRDIFSKLFIANSDGSIRQQLAEFLPNPDTSLPDPASQIPLRPRITADGSQVFFVDNDRDPQVAGVWKVNSDGSGITQIFSYLEMSSQVFGRDGSEYNYNSAFTDGFDISGDGSKIIFGTRTFRAEQGDIRGDAIVYDGGDFHNVGDYIGGNQALATYNDGDSFLMFKLEFNADLGYDEINVYFVPLGTGDPVQVISGLDIFGTPAFTQIAADGSRGIVLGGSGRLPITFVDRVSASQLDLVSIDGISRGIAGFNFSSSFLPSINGNGDKFCFVADSWPRQIWIGEILSDGAASEPKINGIQFTPNYVHNDGSSTATIEAYVSDINDPIDFVTFETVKDGSVIFRALSAEAGGGDVFYPRLVDDGTLGDLSAGDKTYSNNTVRRDVAETPLGDYGIRIAAINTSHRKITMVDAETFSIIDQSTDVQDKNEIPYKFALYQNYPNPFNPTTTISYSVPSSVIANGVKQSPEVTSVSSIPSNDNIKVSLKVYDILGREVATLVNQKQKPGNYVVEYKTIKQHSGIYFYQITSEKFIETKKMILLK